MTITKAESAIAHRLDLPRTVPSVLALGAFLKNTICVTQGAAAFVSPDVGNLDTAGAIAAFERMVEALIAETGAEPVAACHDLHPDFHSTRFAQGLELPAFAVQHHHAHIAAIAAEHGLDQPVIGLALDGFGLGEGKAAWGGEMLHVDAAGYRRLGHLAPLAQPGGDVAAREPWRMAAAFLHAVGRGSEIPTRFAAHKAAALLPMVLEKGVNCPLTSSAGRLFDAACGLLNVRQVAEFEGQAPMELEAMVRAPTLLADGWVLTDGRLDLTPLLRRLADGMAPPDGADLFHGTLIAAFSDWAAWAAEQTGARHVALGGGCFLNKVLTGGLLASLPKRGLIPLTARRLSPGDAGLSFGQAWVAAQWAESGKTSEHDFGVRFL